MSDDFEGPVGCAYGAPFDPNDEENQRFTVTLAVTPEVNRVEVIKFLRAQGSTFSQAYQKVKEPEIVVATGLNKWDAKLLVYNAKDDHGLTLTSTQEPV